MNASDPRLARRRQASGPIAALVVAALVTLLPAFSGWADIYRWEDDKGTIHFTDDLSSIPPSSRDKARPVVREAPVTMPSFGTGESPAAPPKPVPGETRPSDSGSGESREKVREALSSQIEQMKVKIEAKERLIRQVDEKRSLATNPYRNRIVDPSDLDLYDKYQAELPEDREQLKDLESRLESIR